MTRMLRPGHLLGAALLAAALLPATAAAHTAGHDPSADKARGLEFAGLVRSTEPRCRGLYAAGTSGVCTHGPDPAPEGVDVRERRSTAEIVSTTPPQLSDTVPGTNVPPTDGSGAVVCEGDGVSGKRIQTLYVVASDKVDRFDAVKATLGQYAVNADRQYNGSALQNGGARHLRFVTASDGAGGCVLDLRKVVIGSAADDTFNATLTAVKAQGYNRADRKYMMWVDANVYCGIGSIYRDSQPGQANINNGSYAQYGRSDNGCWDYAEAHEMMHNLGGVQPDAPNSTAGFHCTDEYDEMCYDDDGNGPVVMRQICPTSVGTLFDCNDDDYFHAGTAPSGSYLASHWNTATSAFLINPSIAPPDPAPFSESLSGSFSKRSTSQSFTRAALAGPSRIVASGTVTSKGNSSPASVTVRLTGPGTNSTWTGTSIDVSPALPANGSYTWTISGASGVKWALGLTYSR